MLYRLGIIRRRLRANPKLLGRWGEKRCEKFLKHRGFTTIARNYRCKTGEIDLIMCENDRTIVFVEVKTRRDEDFAPAQVAVTNKKRTRMTKAANYFLKNYDVKNKPLRYDVVAVVLGQRGPARIRHYENAFKP